MGYEGKYTQVKEAVRELERVKGEVFVPLIHRPGEAQVDFGYALVKICGELRKVGFFVLVLPHSDAFFVIAFERECTESYVLPFFSVMARSRLGMLFDPVRQSRQTWC